MNFKIANQDMQEVPWLLTNGSAGQHLILPGARGKKAIGSFGIMHFLQVDCPAFNIWHSNYDMSLRTHLYGVAQESMLDLYFVLNNTAHFKLEGLSEVMMLQGQFNLIYAPYVNKITWFQKDEVYTNFGIHFTKDYLVQMSSLFPVLTPFLEKIDKRIACMISEEHGQMTAEITGLVQKILHCHFTGEVRNLYLQSKVLELLLLSLDQMGTRDNKPSDIVLRPYDIEKIREAHDYLLLNMENPCTLIELARKVGINDFKLKKGFKQLYGTTVYDFLLDARMEKATSLLLDSDVPMDEIALATGYQNLSSFITAFKRKMGYSPGSFRKARKGKRKE